MHWYTAELQGWESLPEIRALGTSRHMSLAGAVSAARSYSIKYGATNVYRHPGGDCLGTFHLGALADDYGLSALMENA